MKYRPPYLRTTTNPLRDRRRRGKANLFVLPLLTIAALLVWQQLDAGGRVTTGASEACVGAECALPVRGVEASEKAAAPVPPCPACSADPDAWRAQTSVLPPPIGGRSAAVIEGSCGSLILGIGPHERLAPASLTKLVTAMVVRERGALQDRVRVTVDGAALSAEDGSSVMGLQPGMELSVEELLYGLLLPSGNDAALALSDHFGGAAAFVSMMNDLVRRAGLTNTQFMTPDGRDAVEQYSSAFDMAFLGRQMLQDPVLRKIAGSPSFIPNWSGPTVWNANYLLQFYPGALGIKIGYTEAANFTIVSAAVRDGRELYAAVMGTWNLYGDSRRLLDWAFDNTKPACPEKG
jgi:D-alanyl-D-alanine carboxypeptidase